MEDGKANELEGFYQQFVMELFALANEHTGKAFSSPEEKLTYMREQWAKIEDLVHQQKRNLDFRAGEHKPETLHSAIMYEGKLGDWF